MLDFFQKYHAIPATNAGPQWTRVPEPTLLDWCDSARRNRHQGGHARTIWQEVSAEIERRAAMPNASDAIREAAGWVRSAQGVDKGKQPWEMPCKSCSKPVGWDRVGRDLCAECGRDDR